MVRTSEPKSPCSAEDTVRRYKRLAQVGRAFRSLKGIDLRIRPIHHRTENHVRAHIFLCMLARYVEWHRRRALAPLLFDDEELRQDRAPRPSGAGGKLGFRAGQEDLPAYRRRLAGAKLPYSLAQHGHALPDTCRIPSDPSGATFQQLTEATSPRACALQLLGL